MIFMNKRTFDFNCLLHLWISQEYTFILPTRGQGDLIQTRERNENENPKKHS